MNKERAIEVLQMVEAHGSLVIQAKDMAIKALEYDDAKYHEEHEEVVVDKAVWEDAKRALEQEPINELTKAFTIGMAFGFGKKYDEMNIIMEAIKAIPSADKWIPVSERLPEDSDEYLVSVIDEDDKSYTQVGVAWFAHPKDYNIKEGEWRELMFNEKVIAWMPLPKPYEPQERSE